jgi:hypothetical protein
MLRVAYPLAQSHAACRDAGWSRSFAHRCCADIWQCTRVPVCGLKFEREAGYFWAMYFGYML